MSRPLRDDDNAINYLNHPHPNPMRFYEMDDPMSQNKPDSPKHAVGFLRYCSFSLLFGAAFSALFIALPLIVVIVQTLNGSLDPSEAGSDFLSMLSGFAEMTLGFFAISLPVVIYNYVVYEVNCGIRRAFLAKPGAKVVSTEPIASSIGEQGSLKVSFSDGTYYRSSFGRLKKYVFRKNTVEYGEHDLKDMVRTAETAHYELLRKRGLVDGDTPEKN